MIYVKISNKRMNRICMGDGAYIGIIIFFVRLDSGRQSLESLQTGQKGKKRLFWPVFQRLSGLGWRPALLFCIILKRYIGRVLTNE